jgi:hypothetical protein
MRHVYTVILKPLTPQNIVIGGASGAMPPVLGWAAMTGDVGPQALILFLIIFLWTPPHFWALALYRVEDYRKVGLADVAGDPRQRIHPPADPALHRRVVRRLPVALRVRHEFLAVPGRRRGAEHRVLPVCVLAVARLLGCPGAPRPSVSRCTT